VLLAMAVIEDGQDLVHPLSIQYIGRSRCLGREVQRTDGDNPIGQPHTDCFSRNEILWIAKRQPLSATHQGTGGIDTTGMVFIEQYAARLSSESRSQHLHRNTVLLLGMK